MTPTPILPLERQKTDESLNLEREKTNQSLLESRENTEEDTDKTVVDERAQADEATTHSRKKADDRRDTARNSPDYDIQNEREGNDERLLKERNLADAAIELERKRVDQSIEHERELKTQMAIRVLERERKITDRNLGDERFKTDTLVMKAATAHSVTQTALTSREEFLAIVSHDLRNPIGAAASCAEMLLEDAAFETLDPEVKHWVHFMKRNVDASLRLIADLLDVERISQGKVILNPKKICIGDIVRESVENYVLAATAKTILLRTTPADIKCDVVCDPDRIRQVISNLVGNAVKFTPDGGIITVNIKPETDFVRISILDTGPGIPKEKLTQIFDRFAQLASKDRSGLGLGLYISKMLIEAHGGNLSVESNVGLGSNFKISIPRL
jgi:signal transduction histidine kinase